MPIDQALLSPWTRKHDNPDSSLIDEAPRILYPKTLEDLIEICRIHPRSERLKAAGSHWALSGAAISDHTFIETHDPSNAHQAMGRTLHEVVPGCMNPQLLDKLAADFTPTFTLVHVESGKRIYQLYAELDQVDDFSNSQTLAAVLRNDRQNNRYRGPWAFRTLGDSGGQTVFGALTTGTHGGDFREPPIADSVVAMHLVADGGKHYWIEPETSTLEMPLVNDGKLRQLYDVPKYGTLPGGHSNFDIIRNDDMFNAVLMSAGRFGVVYSVVLLAIPQYSLHEERVLVDWQDVKGHINNPSSGLYNQLYSVPFPGSPYINIPQEFLQIAVCLTPYQFCTKNRAAVTKRWRLFPPITVAGREERVGQRQLQPPIDPQIQAPRFSHAGNSHAYDLDQDPDKPNTGNPSLLEAACADSSFLRGILKAAGQEVKSFVESNGAILGMGIPAIAGSGGTGLLALAPWLLLVIEIIDDILEVFDLDDRLGEQMEHIKDLILGDEDEPLPRGAAGIFVWQLIALLAFESQQYSRKGDAISYAVMETHDYLEQSCRSNVDSVEVFFDATDSRLVAFVDALIEFEKLQEYRGKAFLGYASLRFVGQTRALLGMERYPRTCAIEVACLRDMTGSQEVVDFAVALARSPTFNGILHWGQRNDHTQAEIERIFGDSFASQTGSLKTWRDKLSDITDNGRLGGFSSEFTRGTGLEIVRPKVGIFAASPGTASVGGAVTIFWNCVNNPPATTVSLRMQDPSVVQTSAEGLPLAGQQQIHATLGGAYLFLLTVRLGKREDSRLLTVMVT